MLWVTRQSNRTLRARRLDSTPRGHGRGERGRHDKPLVHHRPLLFVRLTVPMDHGWSEHHPDHLDRYQRLLPP